VNNPANLDNFFFDDIKHEILVHNKHSVAHFSEASVSWDQAKRWGSARSFSAVGKYRISIGFLMRSWPLTVSSFHGV
jgi:hypothetical protein